MVPAGVDFWGAGWRDFDGAPGWGFGLDGDWRWLAAHDRQSARRPNADFGRSAHGGASDSAVAAVGDGELHHGQDYCWRAFECVPAKISCRRSIITGGPRR